MQIVVTLIVLIIVAIILILSNPNENMTPISATSEDVVDIIDTYNLITQTNHPLNLSGTVNLTKSLTVTGTCNLIPPGMIVAYYTGLSGTNTIPTGWALCDGSHGTPDLRGSLVMGFSGSNSSKFPYNVDGVSIGQYYAGVVPSISIVAPYMSLYYIMKL